MKPKVVIIGAGPAGLTAGYLLSKNDVEVLVLEADPVYVGGISRTVTYKGFHFDIGGHRFFSKSREVEDLWSELLPEDMLVRPALHASSIRASSSIIHSRPRRLYSSSGSWSPRAVFFRTPEPDSVL
jgi:protoporphyrinogen oxidase